MRWILQIILIFTLNTLDAADVQLAWDHSASTNVVGYKIYYGTASANYSKQDVVPYQTTWTVSGLDPGTWYFAATAFDIDGNESDYSNEVNTIVNSLINCDVNNDGSVNVLDLQVMANMIIGTVPENVIYDLNHDGVVNILDMQILANVILGNRECPIVTVRP